MKSLTIGYITGRKEPHLEWTLFDLNHLAQDFDVHLIVVDALGRSDIRELFSSPVLLTSCKSFRIVPTKPNIWSGPHRITKQDWWSKANSLNTFFSLADTEWVACLDDRCQLGADWMNAVRRAMDEKYIVCGGYEKRHGMTYTAPYEEKTGTRVAIDNRLEAAPNGNPCCGGQWLYGCSFALPLELALTVNGFEEGCDGQSAEDYIFGLMLANNGFRLDYDPKMWVIQDRSPGQENTYRREDKGVSPNDKSHAALARFGQRKTTEFTPNLRQLRIRMREMPYLGWPVPDPSHVYRDWYDQQPIRDFPGPGETF